MGYRLGVAVAAAAAMLAGPAAARQGQDDGAAPAAKHTQPSAPLPAVDPTPNAQRAPSGISDAAAYRLNPGDEIEIYVWGDERLQRGLRVLPDGSIAFPLVGTVRAAGRTTTQLENEIAQRLAGQYRGTAPQVTISVKDPAGLTISVLGKVAKPGSFSPGRNITLLEAIANAGGPSEFADVNGIIILRKSGARTQVINGQIASVLKGKPNQRDLSPDGIPVLQPGDTVIVP